MKTKLTLLMLAISLGLHAEPQFTTLPGTPPALADAALQIEEAEKLLATATNNQTAAEAQMKTNAATKKTTARAAQPTVATAPADSFSGSADAGKLQSAISPTPAPANRPPADPTMGMTTIRTESDAAAAVEKPAAPAKSATRVSKTPRRKAPVASTAKSGDTIEMQPTAGLPVSSPATPPATMDVQTPASAPTVSAPAAAAAIAPVELKPAAPVAPAAVETKPAVAIPAPVTPAPAPSAPAQPAAVTQTPVPPRAAPATPAVQPAPAAPVAPAVAAIPAAPITPTPPVAPAATVVPPPAAPSVPAPAPSARRPAATRPITTDNPTDVVPAGVLRFQNAPLEQVLEYYSDMVKRTLLRPAQLPAANITINSKTDLTRAETLQALDAVLKLSSIAMIPVGEKFIKVVPEAQANSEAAPLSTHNAADLPELGQYITHVVQLKNSKPSELMQVLQPFAKMPNSILPIDGNQMLVLRDYTENIKRMLELIEQIDIAVPSEFVSEVIPIKYALAGDIQSALSSISGGGGATTTGSRTGTTGRPLAGTQNSLPPTSGGGVNANRPGTTGGAATGAAGANATFAQRLQNIIQRANTTGGDIQLIGPNKIIADERTNALLIFATRQDLETIKDIIGKLDVVLAQVLIEAIILDVSLGDTFDLGVTAGQKSQNIGSSALGGFINNPNGQLTGSQTFLNRLIETITTNIIPVDGGFITNPVSSFSPNPNWTYPSGDGLNYFGRLNSTWDFTLTALAGNNNVKVLARPRIQTSHAVAANIFVGETRPYITGTYFDSGIGGTSRSQYQQTQIGISLNVLPLINTEGLVVMDIQQQVQQVGGSVTIDGNAVPITQDQNASAKVAVNNGETIVLGGFIQNQKSDSKSGVPYLKDIPFFGALFRSTKTTSGRRELLVLIRPTVLATPEVAALQPDIERKRLPGIKQAESEFNEEQAKRMKKSAKKKTVADPEAEFKTTSPKSAKSAEAQEMQPQNQK